MLEGILVCLVCCITFGLGCLMIDDIFDTEMCTPSRLNGLVLLTILVIGANDIYFYIQG